MNPADGGFLITSVERLRSIERLEREWRSKIEQEEASIRRRQLGELLVIILEDQIYLRRKGVLLTDPANGSELTRADGLDGFSIVHQVDGILRLDCSVGFDTKSWKFFVQDWLNDESGMQGNHFDSPAGCLEWLAHRIHETINQRIES